MYDWELFLIVIPLLILFFLIAAFICSIRALSRSRENAEKIEQIASRIETLHKALLARNIEQNATSFQQSISHAVPSGTARTGQDKNQYGDARPSGTDEMPDETPDRVSEARDFTFEKVPAPIAKDAVAARAGVDAQGVADVEDAATVPETTVVRKTVPSQDAGTGHDAPSPDTTLVPNTATPPGATCVSDSTASSDAEFSRTPIPAQWNFRHAVAEALAYVRRNTWTVGGILLLLAGISFLISYLGPRWFTLELRLALGMAIGLALLGAGWRLRRKNAAFAALLQGGGIAIGWFVSFAAFKLYALVPQPLALGMFIILAVTGGILAVAQNSQPLAWVGTVGAFLAPTLLSTGGDNHIALFSYFALVDIAVFRMARHKVWPGLNLLSYAMTATLGIMWGSSYYYPGLFTSTQVFLSFFFLLFTALPILIRKRHGPHPVQAKLDGFLSVFTPTLFLFLEWILCEGRPYTLALFFLGTAAIQMISGKILSGFKDDSGTTHSELFFITGIICANGAIFIVLNRELCGALWTVSGALLFMRGTRRNDLAQQGMGAALILGGAYVLRTVFFLFAPSHPPASSPVIPYETGLLIGFVSCLAALYGMRATRIRERGYKNAGISESDKGEFPSPDARKFADSAPPANSVKTTSDGASSESDASNRTARDNAACAVENGKTREQWAGFPSPTQNKAIQGLLSVPAQARVGAALCAVILIHGLIWWYCQGIWRCAAIFSGTSRIGALLIFLSLSGLGLTLGGYWSGKRGLRFAAWPPLLYALHMSLNYIPVAVCAVYRLDFLFLIPDMPYYPHMESRFVQPAWLIFFVCQYLGLYVRDRAANRIGSLRDKGNVALHGHDNRETVVLHILNILLLCIVWGLSSRIEIQRLAQLPLSWTLLIGMLILAALFVALFFTAKKINWPIPAHNRIYKVYAPGALALALMIWDGCHLFASGDAAPLPYVPLLNPLELNLAFPLVLGLAWSWKLPELSRRYPYRRQFEGKTLHNQNGHCSWAAFFRALFAISAFIWLHLVIGRALHQYAGLNMSVFTFVFDRVFQAGVTLLWAVSGLTMVLVSRRMRARGVWKIGAALLVAAVIKLLLFDMSDASPVERIITFIAMGLLLLATGYFAPLPPAGDKAASRSSEASETPQSKGDSPS